MPSAQVWLQAARLRTLPLSISGILVGGAMALREGLFRWDVFCLALLATLGFQILSNYANDYGDGVKGTDNQDRVGPARAIQEGLLTPSQLINGMWVTTAITIVVVIVLIYVSFGQEQPILSTVYFLLGIAAIVAAIKYTVGKSAYGYRGLGDLFVFLFFGFVSVLGSYFLFTTYWPSHHFLGAVCIGCLATLVLHLNNMRDRESDAKGGKNTLAVHLGKKGALRYHNVLLGLGILSWLGYLWLANSQPIHYASAIAFLPLFFHFIKVQKTSDHKLLDPQLKIVALSTFLLSFLYFVISSF
jgi:1,4-dihydroxy-2-naphthoate octaprenyltransferase